MTIHRSSHYVLALFAALAFTVAAFAAPSVEIKLKDGSRWRGSVSDIVQMRYQQQSVEVPLEGTLIKAEPLYVVVEGLVAGVKKQVTIFRADIVSMKTLEAGSGVDTSAKPANTTTPASSSNAASTSTSTSTSGAAEAAAQGPGVFVLPWEGMVGLGMRHEELKKLGEHIDKNYGPGQIIVMHINTDGGSSFETQKIGDTIRDLRKRHRVVAWIEKAISAGCHTSMFCNEIYFMTQGTAGSVTTWSGNLQAVRGNELDRILEDFVRIAEENGYSKHIALSMKMNEFMCSYDKDPVTGEVTFYGDLSGEFILSDANSNLCFTSSNAEHSGFSDGTADNGEQLAKLLNLPQWRELDQYGRKLAADWKRTLEEGVEEIPLLLARYNYKNTSTGDAVVILGTRIGIIEDLLKWWKRAPNLCEFSGFAYGFSVPPQEALERELAELRKTLSDIRRAQR